nr:uncharacterized protein LOC104087514 [Nicotiana tomentosiformis]
MLFHNLISFSVLNAKKENRISLSFLSPEKTHENHHKFSLNQPAKFVLGEARVAPLFCGDEVQGRACADEVHVMQYKAGIYTLVKSEGKYLRMWTDLVCLWRRRFERPQVVVELFCDKTPR